jgi:hypothetical protein
MGLFKRKKNAVIEVETCVVDEWLRNMWNVFTKTPRRVSEKEGYVELEWIALDSWEEEYIQYAWLRENEAEIEDRSTKLFINRDGFIYKDVKVYRCRKIIVPSWHCNEFGCKALLLSPEEAMKRLWRLYEKAKKVKSV